jgi:hypothetical protein
MGGDGRLLKIFMPAQYALSENVEGSQLVYEECLILCDNTMYS